MNAFLDQVRTTIDRESLLSPEDRVLVALSGGADSVALLRALLALGYRVEAAHCNFGLRGEESDRDERFVRQLCQELQVPLTVKAFDTRREAQQQKVSIEMAARTLRYRFFDELLSAHGLQAVAVAHHRDDAVETFLLNLVRGTGLHGLTGMRYRNGSVVRPFLDVSRSQVLAFLDALGQPFVQDSSNFETEFVRNKLRLEVLPMLRQLNPSIDASIQHTARHLRQAEKMYEQALQSARERVCQETGPNQLLQVDVDKLLQEPDPQLLLFELLRPYDFNETQRHDLYRALLAGEATGALFHTDKAQLTVTRQGLQVFPAADCEAPASHLLQEQTPLALSEGCLRMRQCSLSSLPSIPRERTIATLDADTLSLPLRVRRPAVGDRFRPFGMTGTRLLSDFLTDLHLSRLERTRQWVVCSGKEIAWVVGHRIDARFAVTPTTHRIVQLFWEN